MAMEKNLTYIRKMPYRKKNYWAHQVWALIHTLCVIDFENNEPIVLKTIEALKSLKYSILCESCRIEYEKEFSRLDGLDPREHMVLFKWSVEFHNKINMKTCKPLVSYEEALGLWTTVKEHLQTS